MKFGKVEDVVNFLEKKLKNIGIIVVDTAVYQGQEFLGENNKVGVITGYMENEACMFTVSFGFHETGNSYYKFRIDGQLQEETDITEREDWTCGCFPSVMRNPTGHESFGWPIFMVNDSQQSLSSDDSEKVEVGIAFFQNFLGKYGKDMAQSFSKTMSLWFVPEYSVDLLELEKKNGRYNSDNYIGFNKRVMEKFPTGFFAKEQKP